jgi:hypothetical protein
MNKILISTIALVMISGCGNTSEVKPQIVETPQGVQPVVTPKAEVKKVNPFEEARKWCLNGNSQACISLGYMAVNKEDYKLAKTAFNETYRLGNKDGGIRGYYYLECLEKNGKSCNMLGYMAEEGKGGKQDYKLARVAYQKAIDLGYTDALGSLAFLYAEGQGGERSDFKATKLFEKSCNVGTRAVDYANCFNAGVAYQDGKGVRQDNFKALKLYQKACNNGHADSCGNLGYMYKYGKGVRQSNSTALMYVGKGCDLGSDLACENYAKSNR